MSYVSGQRRSGTTIHDIPFAIFQFLFITPAIIHDHEICVLPVFPVNVVHTLLYLVAAVITEDGHVLEQNHEASDDDH